MERLGGYRELRVWQRGIYLVERVYVLTANYPRDGQFGLTAQTRRAAVSVPANIAEGCGRGTQGSYASFLRIARGSLRELETHLIIADRIGLVSGQELEGALAECEEIGRMIHALIAKVRTSPSIN